ncbi:MAG: HD domain-containing protein [Malacoplasma sp.]
MADFCIKDPIYNEINFKDDEWAFQLLQTKELIRLQNINQLGISNKIFPSATNSRFSHSIGTFEIAKRFSKHLISKFSITEYERKLFLATALLHDIGHGPFSHVFEIITKIKHEDFTKSIILDKNLQVNKILVNFGLDPLDIVSVLFGTYKKEWISKLISSNLDVDRIDYMLRDAYFLGTHYSTIDVNFLVERTYIIDNNVYFQADSSNIIESFLLGRYYMHNDIYDNLNTYSYEWCLKMIFTRLKEISDKFIFFREKIYYYDLFSWIIFDKLPSNEIFIELHDYNFYSFISSLQFIGDKILNSFVLYFLYGNYDGNNKFIEFANYSEILENKLIEDSKEIKIDAKYLFLVFKKASKDYYSIEKKSIILLFDNEKNIIFEFPYKGILELKNEKTNKNEKIILLNKKIFF